MFNLYSWIMNRDRLKCELVMSRYLIDSLERTLNSMDDECLGIIERSNKHDALGRISSFKQKYRAGD